MERLTETYTPTWKWAFCGLLLLATMLNYMDRLTLSQTSTIIERDPSIKLTDTRYGYLESGFSIAFACGGLLVGFLVDRSSIRWIYPTVLLGWSTAGLATGLVHSYPQLVACRIALGLFEAGQWPCALAAIQRLLTPNERTLGNSILQSGAALGSIITPQIVKYSIHQSPGNWRGPFIWIGILGVLWVIPWHLMMRGKTLAPPPQESEDGQPERLPEGFWRRLAVLFVVVCAININWQFFRAWLPRFLEKQQHYSYDETQNFTTWFWVVTDIGCLTAGLATRWLTRRGVGVHSARVRVYLACCLLTALSTVAAGLPRGPALLALLLAVAAGSLGLFPVYYSLTQELPLKHLGKITGLLSAACWIAAAGMQGVVGEVVERTQDYALAIRPIGLLPLVGFIPLWLFWNRSAKLRDLPPEPVAELLH